MNNPACCDPLVLAHARALLTPAGTGRIAYLDADLRRPEEILSSPEVGAFDPTKPVALTLIAVLQHITDDQQAVDLIARLTEPLPTGSAIAISAVTVENDPDGGPGTVRTYNQNGVPVVARNRAGVEALFTGFTLIDPGVVPVHHW